MKLEIEVLGIVGDFGWIGLRCDNVMFSKLEIYRYVIFYWKMSLIVFFFMRVGKLGCIVIGIGWDYELEVGGYGGWFVFWVYFGLWIVLVIRLLWLFCLLVGGGFGSSLLFFV